MPLNLSKRARYLVLAAIIVGLLYPLLFYTPPYGGLWTQVFLNSLHVPVFGLIAVSVFVFWRPQWPWFRRAATAFAVTCVFGLISEIAQVATSRDASFSDFIADCLGAAGFLGVAIGVLPGHRLTWARRTIAGTLGLAMLGWALTPLTLVSAAYIERNQQFPVIYSADSSFGRRLVRAQNIRYEVIKSLEDEEAHAEISFLDAPWPGIALHDIWPDWHSYKTLVIDLAINGETVLALGLRVHDDAHRHSKRFNDRFNRTYDLGPGRHTLRILLSELRHAPQSREMDLGNVSELIIYGTQAEAGRSFRLYSVRLE
jgi:VanZ family protein